jgi:hypothetical protein
MRRLTAITENKYPVLQKRENKKIKFSAFAEKYITDYSKPNKKSYKCDIKAEKRGQAKNRRNFLKKKRFLLRGNSPR